MTGILLDIVGPIFGLMALGFSAVRMRALDAAGVRGLVMFVFNFAIPVLLFRSLAEVALPDDIAWGFLLAFYTGSLVTYGSGMALAKFLGRPLDQQAIFGMSGAFSNTVLLGIPIIITAFGPDATLPIFLIVAFHSATFMPLTVGLIQLARGEATSVGSQIASAFREVARNPIVVGLFLGLIANLSGLSLPTPAARLADLLSGAAVPCALFAMGASLAGYPLRGDLGPAIALSLLKTALHPLIVWVMAVPVLHLEGLWVAVAVVMAAMPSGVNVYLFAARYEAAPDVAARTVMLTSAFSMVTISVLLALFGV